MRATPVSPADFERAEGTSDWRAMYWGAHAFFSGDTYAQGALLVGEIARLAVRTHHDPDVDLRREGVAVTLITREARDLTDADVELARRISTAAARIGMTAEPSKLQVVQIAVASVPTADVADFWMSTLGYVRQGPSHLVDPLRRNPSVFLQGELDEDRPRRGRVHVDVCVPSDQLIRRAEAAVAAGGRTVPSQDPGADWVTVADAENHGVDIVSTIGRASTRLAEAPASA